MEEFNSVATAAAEVEAISDASQTLILIVGLAVLGVVGRLLVIAFGDRVAGMNPLRNASGVLLVVVALGGLFGAMFWTNGLVKTRILFQRTFIDPIIVSVLERDSCDVESGAYCVVVFENGREMIVNWHDKRVEMIKIVTPPMNPPWGSLKPQARPLEYSVQAVNKIVFGLD